VPLAKGGFVMHERSFLNGFLLIILCIVLGVAAALIWFYGPVLLVRDMLPYALGVTVVMLTTTSIMKAQCGNSPEDWHLSQTYLSLSRFSAIVIISAAVFIVFALTVMATYFSLTVRMILAIVGSVSFFVMLFAFIDMILSISLRHHR
jgi:hypothetical protein